jgi:hypothetical protein
MTERIEIETIKTRAFLLEQEGHKRLRGSTPQITDLTALNMVSAGTRVKAHVNSGATVGEIRSTRAYQEMLALELDYEVVG